MVIFFNHYSYGNAPDMRIALPLEKIVSIVQHGKTIDISFCEGEYVTLEFSEVPVPKVSVMSLNYDHIAVADDVMRSFYVACEQGKGAFYFNS